MPMDRLEAKIDRNATAIADLLVITKILQDREEQRITNVCNVHHVDLVSLGVRVSTNRDAIQKLKLDIANRWPNLIAAAVGAMLPVTGLVVALIAERIKHG